MNKEPSSFPEFIGQEKIKRDLDLHIKAAKIRKEPLSHVLISGPHQMGKSTLVHTAARMMGGHGRLVNCGAKMKESDIAAVLTHMREGDFLILENLELLAENVVRLLSEAMENFVLDIVVGKGPAAKNVKLRLPRFTVVGLTARPRQIANRLRHQFLFHYEFEPYDRAEISRLIELFVKERQSSVTPSAANLLATYCKGALGDARALAHKVADYCLVKFQAKQIEYKGAISALVNLGYLDESKSSQQIADTLNNMSGIEFEAFLAELFATMGYTAELTQSSGDHGIDIFLKRGPESIAVQCKRWSKPVGEPIVRDFYGALLNSGAAKGMIITTTTFTPQAIEFAAKKPIMLVDIEKLIELVKRF